MSVTEENFQYVVGCINTKVEQYLQKTSSWWVILPNLEAQEQYSVRHNESQAYLIDIQLLYSLLPSEDVKTLGVKFSTEEISAKFSFDLNRAGSLLSEHQKLLKRT